MSIQLIQAPLQGRSAFESGARTAGGWIVLLNEPAYHAIALKVAIAEFVAGIVVLTLLIALQVLTLPFGLAAGAVILLPLLLTIAFLYGRMKR